MIKMCFFDKSNNSMIVNALKQLLNRRDSEKLFTGIPQMGAFQKDMLYSEWKSTKIHKILTCAQKLPGSQIYLEHGNKKNKKCNEKTKSKTDKFSSSGVGVDFD